MGHAKRVRDGMRELVELLMEEDGIDWMFHPKGMGPKFNHPPQAGETQGSYSCQWSDSIMFVLVLNNTTGILHVIRTEDNTTLASTMAYGLEDELNARRLGSAKAVEAAVCKLTQMAR